MTLNGPKCPPKCPLIYSVFVGGAKAVKVFDSPKNTMEYAAKTFKFPGQRIIGGEEGPGSEVRSAPPFHSRRAAPCLPGATRVLLYGHAMCKPPRSTGGARPLGGSRGSPTRPSSS